MSYEWKQIFLWYKKKREQDKDQLNNPPGLQNFYKIIRLLDRKTNQPNKHVLKKYILQLPTSTHYTKLSCKDKYQENMCTSFIQ